MKVKVQVIIESGSGNADTVENINCLERVSFQSENMGLTLAEAKTILAGVQKTMVDRQSTDYLKQQCRCPDCSGKSGNHSFVRQ